MVVALLGLMLLGSSPSYAACKWVWDCSGGACSHVPVCQSPTDIVPPEPPDLPPIAPPTIEPLDTPSLPPVGTQTCANRYICEAGQCAWREVCR
jgi:hypothetical protein